MASREVELGHLDLSEQQLHDRQRAEEFARQVAATKERGYLETKQYIAATPLPANNLYSAGAAHDHYALRANAYGQRSFNEADSQTGLLSADDYWDAYRRGGAKAAREWYFEQKREHHLGRQYQMEQSDERQGLDEALRVQNGVLQQQNYDGEQRGSRQQKLSSTQQFWQLPEPQYSIAPERKAEHGIEPKQHDQQLQFGRSL
jgi:hypothetical protein